MALKDKNCASVNLYHRIHHIRSSFFSSKSMTVFPDLNHRLHFGFYIESADVNQRRNFRHSRYLLQTDQNGSHSSQVENASTSVGMNAAVVGIITGIVVFFAVLLLVGCVVICRWKIKPLHRTRQNSPMSTMKLPSLRNFNKRESSKVFDPSLASISMRDLVKATDDFDCTRVIGDGGFGLVFSATLADGRVVAVKKLATDGIQGKREFQAEMETLGKIKHQNLVELLAYCSMDDENMLVYEFVHNGSLDSWLYERDDGPQVLHWNRRLNIALGAARGLAYLHYECNPHVIHRDIKSSNILLGIDFEPKIADFGLARNMNPQLSHVSTIGAGTLGYMAPEYAKTLKATRKGDVYSFGMLMLELVIGKRPNQIIYEKKFRSLNTWARHMVQQGLEMDLLDPHLKDNCPPMNVIKSYFSLACECVLENPENRPSMKLVYEKLSLLVDPKTSQP